MSTIELIALSLKYSGAIGTFHFVTTGFNPSKKSPKYEECRRYDTYHHKSICSEATVLNMLCRIINGLNSVVTK